MSSGKQKSNVPPTETELEENGSKGSQSGTESARRVADVLLLLGSRPGPIGVTEIARDLDMSKAVVHRILQSLLSRQLVSADSTRRTYGLGAAAAALGARALNSSDLRRTALPVLRRLQTSSCETATVSALVGMSRVYLGQIVSLQQIRMEVELGRPFPLHAGASSKAILAAAPTDLRDYVLTMPLPKLTNGTVTDLDRLRAELQEIQRTGVAISHSERQEGAGSVAAAVFSLDGSVVGSISICGPVNRFDKRAIERYVPMVKAGAAEISDSMREP